MSARPSPTPSLPKLLIVDDDPVQRKLLQTYLGRHGFTIHTEGGGEAALAALERETYGLVISDVRMPGVGGLELLHRLRPRHDRLPVLLVTAFPDIRDAVDAMRDGAVNYLEKPIDLDELLASVRHAIGLGPAAPAEEPSPLPLPEDMIAASDRMRDVLREVALVAPTESRVLITGESGAGKEMIADLIHGLSPRTGKALVKLNCAAIPETLLESELFGHERGSFTGAVAQRAGCFEQADGGTLLLDEIAEMSPALQAKLLRVTQDGSFRRVGGSRDLKTDVRLLAATHRDLEVETREGRFREDLFYRLSVFEIYLPPLRERRADIRPLAELFARRFGGERIRVSPATLAILEQHAWPGNVRELRNAMERAALMARGGVILPEHLPQRVRTEADDRHGSAAPDPAGGTRMEEVERSVILQTLRENKFNRSETARKLGISRRTLIYKLRRFREEGHMVDSE